MLTYDCHWPKGTKANMNKRGILDDITFLRVKLSLCLTKNHTMETYRSLN